MSNSKDCPYVTNQFKTIAVVADGHKLFVIFNGEVFMLDNPSNPPPHITLPTVPVSMSDTPEELLQKLSKIEGLATP